jgi:hypothetical protein
MMFILRNHKSTSGLSASLLWHHVTRRIFVFCALKVTCFLAVIHLWYANISIRMLETANCPLLVSYEILYKSYFTPLQSIFGGKVNAVLLSKTFNEHFPLVHVLLFVNWEPISCPHRICGRILCLCKACHCSFTTKAADKIKPCYQYWSFNTSRIGRFRVHWNINTTSL